MSGPGDKVEPALAHDDDDLDARLAAAQAEFEAIEREREARARADEKRRRVEALERDARDARAIAKAEEEIGVGRFAVIKTELGAVIVKRPHHMHYRRFINLAEPKSDDATRLVLTCLVHPSRAQFDALIEELPAVPVIAASAVVDLAAGRKVSGK